MRILLLTNSDYANFQYNLWQSALKVGLDCDAYKLVRHHFGYETQCEIITIEGIKKILNNYDIVILTHAPEDLFQVVKDKKVIPYYTGTNYRMNPSFYNRLFENSPFSLIALPEFQYTANNFKYLVGAIDIEKDIKPLGDKLVLGHFPSNPSIKGTMDILKIVDELKQDNDFDFKYSTERVSHQEQLERINECDIYIELLSSEQDGKPYGSWGITSLEAASLGKIVITQAVHDNGLYNETYGVSMLNTVVNQADLKKVLSGLLNYKGDFIRGQQELTKKWVKDNHSYEATGNKLKQYLNGL